MLHAMSEAMASSAPAATGRGVRWLAVAMLVLPLAYLAALCLYGWGRLDVGHTELISGGHDPKDLVPFGVDWFGPPLLAYGVVVLTVMVGPLPGTVLALVAAVTLALPPVRADRRAWWLLLVATLATVAFLLISAVPFGADLRGWFLD
jgi:hypothetical protein